MNTGTLDILGLARQAVAGWRPLSQGETLTIYESNGLHVYLQRFQELLLMTGVNGDPTQAERVGIGYWSVYSGWVIDLDRAAYQRWADRVKRLAHPTFEEKR